MPNIASVDRELLLAHVLRKPREWVIAHPSPALRPSQRRRLRALVHRRARGEPLAYLLGEQWFYGRPLVVNHHVLIPRPETELLIDVAHEWTVRNGDPYPSTIIDVGTGSGCIAVTVAAELPHARVIAIDSSTNALRVARGNARRNGVSNRITFRRGDLLSPVLRTLPTQPTLILANLPYLTSSEWRKLPRALRAYEPRAAFDGGRDGIAPFRALFAQLRTLATRAPLRTAMLEIDPRRKRALTALIRKTLPGWEASWHRDLAGRWRILELQHPTSTALR